MDPDPPSLSFLSEIFQPFQIEYLIPLVILVLLLLASALISGSEVAFFSLNPQDLEEVKNSNPKGHELLEDLLSKPKSLLATILITNNFTNVGIIILSSFLTNSLFDFTNYPTLGWIVQVVSITFILLLFGEVLPKIYANKESISFSLRMSKAMMLLRSALRPVSRLLVRSTSFLEKRLKTNSKNLSVDDLTQALELTDESEVDDQKILEGIVKFGNTNVKQVMKARTDVVCIPKDWNYAQLMKVILDSGYSRIPVFEDNFDNVKGILYIKDILPHIEKAEDFNWQELLREPFYVPENKKLDDLLKEFQEKKIHLAIVVDEFGGTSGIITLEDVIEEIVGEISDEFDDDELFYSKLDDNNYVFEAKIHLTDFLRVMELDSEIFGDEMAEADSLAGLLLEIAGKFPLKGEEILYKGFTFIVESLEDRRIKRIKVKYEAEGN